MTVVGLGAIGQAVADGLDGGRFASHLIERLEDPYRLLL